MNQDNKIEVTFKALYQVKVNTKWVNKVSLIVEEHKNESNAKLRAQSLNWQIVKIKSLAEAK